jgi:hypothetical protein
MNFLMPQILPGQSSVAIARPGNGYWPFRSALPVNMTAEQRSAKIVTAITCATISQPDETTLNMLRSSVRGGAGMLIGNVPMVL